MHLHFLDKDGETNRSDAVGWVWEKNQHISVITIWCFITSVAQVLCFLGGTQCDGHAELGKPWRGPDAGFRLPVPAPGWTQCPVSHVTVPLLWSDSFKGLYKCSRHTFAGLLNGLSFIFMCKVMTVTKWFSPLNRLITQATKDTDLKEILLHISVMSGCSLPWKWVPTLIFFWGEDLLAQRELHNHH